MKQTQTNRTVSTPYGNIEYILTIKSVKNINIRIKSDCKVYVSANSRTNVSYIDNLICEKSKMIINSINKFTDKKKNVPSAKLYVDGERFSYLGKELILKVMLSEKNEVYIDGIYLFLNVNKPEDTALKKKLIDSWFDTQCKAKMAKLVEETYQNFKKYNIKYPYVCLRKMTSRWGSCSVNKQKITLNKMLIGVPENCIRYVIIHEFTHFIHPNHSKNFYSFLQMMMPEWKELKSQLENFYIYNF